MTLLTKDLGRKASEKKEVASFMQIEAQIANAACFDCVQYLNRSTMSFIITRIEWLQYWKALCLACIREEARARVPRREVDKG